MKRTWLALVTLAAGLVGCGEPAPEAAPPSGTPVIQAAPTPPGAEPAPVATASLTEEEVAEVKKLPEAEQAAALAQIVCPISDEHLGSMGAPLKVEHAGKTYFFLCCKGCSKQFAADPAAAVAKLAKKEK